MGRDLCAIEAKEASILAIIDKFIILDTVYFRGYFSFKGLLQLLSESLPIITQLQIVSILLHLFMDCCTSECLVGAKNEGIYIF